MASLPVPGPAGGRRVALARVLAVWPEELEDESLEARSRIVGKLRRALRAERRRGVAGHWTYDLGRHAELLRLYREEMADLAGRTTCNSTGAEAASTKARSREG